MRQAALPIICLLTLGLARGEELKDPTRPPDALTGDTRRASAPALVVTAVFLSSERRVAIVNDRPVRVGDHIGVHVILEINADGVRYSSARGPAFARLAGQERAGDDE
jgi:hypothetical protein